MTLPTAAAPWLVQLGKNLEHLRSLPDACIDALVTDPPSLRRPRPPTLLDGRSEPPSRDAGVADPQRGGRDGLHEREQLRYLETDPGGGRQGLASRVAPWPPGPLDTNGWREYLARWPGLEPALCRGADGTSCRVDRLRALGNAVVPPQAALAWTELWTRRFQAPLHFVPKPPRAAPTPRQAPSGGVYEWLASIMRQVYG